MGGDRELTETLARWVEMAENRRRVGEGEPMDAVDEAEHPNDLVTALLLPLASTRRADMKPLCRVLIAPRPEEGLRHLLEDAAERDGLLDLDEVPAERLRRDLVNFVSRVLRPIGTGTSAWCSLPPPSAWARRWRTLF
ncbi:hypothetical protein C3488_33595 [Streptomyces sp. Ru72]|nr:hypothetical protein C3488_33595 [Streptomyces sp. Ru72]